jgi:hypothetical protein
MQGQVVRPFFGGCLAALVLNLSLALLGPTIVAALLANVHDQCLRSSAPFWMLLAVAVIIPLAALVRIARSRGRDIPQWSGFLAGTVLPFIPMLLALLRASSIGCHRG